MVHINELSDTGDVILPALSGFRSSGDNLVVFIDDAFPEDAECIKAKQA